MSITPRLSEWLEHPDQQTRLSAIASMTTLPAIVLVALQVGLMVSRWAVETEITRRAQAPQAWGQCPQCGHRLHSKGFQRRQIQTLVGRIA